MPRDTAHHLDTPGASVGENGTNFDFGVPTLASLQVTIIEFVSSYLVLASRG